MAIGRLAPNAQVYQESGEAAVQAQLPEQFISNPQPPSPVTTRMQFAYESYHDNRQAPIVSRVPRMNGMRTLYNRAMSRLPVRNLGGDGPAYPWDSGFNKNNIGPIRNCHFNDALFQAGYPGFNLGLSFKAPQIQTQSSQMRPSATYAPRNIDVSLRPPKTERAE